MLSGFVGGVLALLLALSPVIPASSSISMLQQVGAVAANDNAYATRCEKGHVYVLVIGADGGMSITASAVSNPDAIPIVSIITQSDGKVTRKICSSGLVVDAAPQSSQAPSASAPSSGQDMFESEVTAQTGSYIRAPSSYFGYIQCAFGYGDCSTSPEGSKAPSNGEQITVLQNAVAGRPSDDSSSAPAFLISGDSVELEVPRVSNRETSPAAREVSQSETTFGRQDAPPPSASVSEPGWLDWRRVFSLPGIIVCFLIPSDCKAYQYIKDGNKKPPQQ